MKKIALLLGLFLMTTSFALAQNYTKQEDGSYVYTGSPVNQLVVDFTTWQLADLPTALTNDGSIAENQGLGFVKWKIAQRTCGTKGNVNALFNNDNSDFGGGSATKNNNDPIKPRIYLPTTTASVDNIVVFAGNGNVPVSVYYKDDNHAEWTLAGEIALTSTYAEHKFPLKSKGQTSIYLEYTRTQWIAFTDLVLEIEGAPKAVSEITLNITKTQLAVGNTLELKATVLPEDATDKTVTWVSDAPTIASVDNNGIVTAIASGIAQISATAGVKTAACTIEVKDKVVFATGIQWNVANKEFSMNLRDSLQLTYTILPEDATEREVILSSSNKSCVRITPEGMAYADGGGVAILTATLGDFTDKITITVDDPNMPKGELDWDPDGTYWGDSVNYIYEDFTQWPLSALPNPITTEDLYQYKKLGFIRWTMAKRANLIGVQQWDNTDQRTALFTNNPTINGFHTDTAHRAYIYFPTLKNGAGAIRIIGYASTSGGNAISVQISWFNEEYDEFSSGYTFIKSIPIVGDGTNISESSLDVEGPVTLQISYQQTPYPSIYSIQISPYGMPLSDNPDQDFGQTEGWVDILDGTKAIKMIVDGQLVIVKNGKTYNVLGNILNTK